MHDDSTIYITLVLILLVYTIKATKSDLSKLKCKYTKSNTITTNNCSYH